MRLLFARKYLTCFGGSGANIGFGKFGLIKEVSEIIMLLLRFSKPD